MSLAHAASVQYRVVLALVLREARGKFGETRLGYFWAVMEPLLWLLTFYGALSLGKRQLPPGVSTMLFLVTGIGTYQLFQKVADSLTGSIGGNRALLVFPHVVPFDVFVARSILNFVTILVVNAILIAIETIVTGNPVLVKDPLQVLGAISCAGIMGFGFGLALGAASNYTIAINRVKVVIVRPLFWTSGLFFMANDLPSGVREIFLYNPLLHCTEIVRGGWFSQYDARHADPGYMISWAVGLLLVGLASERAARPQTES